MSGRASRRFGTCDNCGESDVPVESVECNPVQDLNMDPTPDDTETAVLSLCEMCQRRV